MELDSDHKVGIFAIACAAIVISLLISCVTYYNIEKNSMVERMVDRGVSPALLECVKLIGTYPDHKICTMILTNHDINDAQAKKLLEGENNGQ